MGELEQLKTEYEEKLDLQKEQMLKMRNSAARATTTSIERDRKTRQSMEEMIEERMEEKDRIIEELRLQLQSKETMERSYHRLKQNKKKMEQQMMAMTQQIFDTVSNSLSDDVKRKLAV